MRKREVSIMRLKRSCTLGMAVWFIMNKLDRITVVDCWCTHPLADCYPLFCFPELCLKDTASTIYLGLSWKTLPVAVQEDSSMNAFDESVLTEIVCMKMLLCETRTKVIFIFSRDIVLWRIRQKEQPCPTWKKEFSCGPFDNFSVQTDIYFKKNSLS